jgi:hypothetical protein
VDEGPGVSKLVRDNWTRERSGGQAPGGKAALAIGAATMALGGEVACLA